MLLKKGQQPEHIARLVRELITRLQNVTSAWGIGPAAYEGGKSSYLQAVEDLERLLRSAFEDDDGVGAGLYGDMYRLIRDMNETTARPYPLIRDEAERQIATLETLQTRLAEVQSLRNRSGHPAIIDTNCLMHYQRLDRITWREILCVEPIRLVLPILVIDELDNKKYTGSDKMAARANSAIKALHDYSNGLRPGCYAELPDGSTIEVWLDEPGHKRKLNPDEELLSRGILLQRVLEVPVTIVSGDLGMRLRAEAHGLEHTQMPDKYAKDAARRASATEEA